MSDEHLTSSPPLGGGTGAGDPRATAEYFIHRLEMAGWRALPCHACERDGHIGVHSLVETLRALLVSSPHGWQHAATMLAKSLPDAVLEEMREVWGNTNVAVIKHWRDQVLPLEARETPQGNE